MSRYQASQSTQKTSGPDAITVCVMRDRETGAEIRTWPGFGNQSLFLALATPDGRLVRLIQHLDPDEVRRCSYFYGIPILFPWPGNVVGARYTFDGVQYQLNEVLADGGAHHGFVRSRAWQVDNISQSDESAEIRCSIEVRPGSPDYDSYPFPCRLTVTHKLQPAGLTISALVANLGEKPMPFGFGLHPFFSVPFGPSGSRDRCLLQVPGDTLWNWDAVNTAAAGSTLSETAFPDLTRSSPYGKTHPLGPAHFNEGFTALHAQEDMVTARVFDPDSQICLSVAADRDFQTFLVYTPPAPRSELSLEPWTCTGNAFNLAAAGFPGSGLRILQPGTTWSGKTQMSVGLAP